MKRLLKLTLFISAIFHFIRVSAIPADTLIKSKYVTFEVNYGLPVFNQLSINNVSGNGNYSVNSKPKSFFDVRLGIVRKKSIVHLGFSLIQSEFTGKEYSMGAGVIPYKGLKYPYYYNMYQHINYNVYYFNIGYAYNFRIAYRHIVSPQIQLSVPLVYSFKIDNIYSKSQLYDTSLFSASKNSWNNDTNFGRLPRLGLGVAYSYQIITRVAVTAKLHMFYSYTYDRKYPETKVYGTAFNHSENYSFLAYDISRQIALIPSIGVNIKIN